MQLRFGRCSFVIFEILCLGLGVCNCDSQRCHIVKDLGMAEYGLQGPGDAVNVTTDSVIQCGSLCFQEKQCFSFFFNTVTKTCKGLTDTLTNFDQVVVEDGSTYFRLTSCLFRGFTYGQSTNVTRPADANQAQLVPFDHEITVSGIGGKVNAGVFTCQREGLYKVHMYVLPKDLVDVSHLTMYKNNVQVVKLRVSDLNVAGMTAMLELQTGDVVYGRLVNSVDLDSSAFGHGRDMFTTVTAIYVADLNEGRPCFTVGLSTDQDLTTTSDLVYDTLLTDIGGMYSASTGQVIIGVSGIYIFHIHAHAKAGLCVDLQVDYNANTMCHIKGRISGGVDSRSAALGNTFLLHMDAGNTLTVKNNKLGSESGLRGYYPTPTNTITGLLVASNTDLNNGKPMSAFSVAVTSILEISPGDTVKYDHVIYDLNDDYNLQTGEFVAHISGLYEFNFHVMGHWHEKLWLELYCNDRYIVSAYGERGGNDPYPVVGNAAVSELNTNDRCYIKSVSFINKIWGHSDCRSTTFTGYLVAPKA